MTGHPLDRPAGSESISAARGFSTVAIIAVQLALALLVVHRFQLESRTFFSVFALCSAGFVVHALLPLRYRLGFFCALSVAAIVLALGVFDGLAVIGLGMTLIVICHLPLELRWRVGLLLAVAALFALWRIDAVPSPWSGVIWPVLGSMFMFRIALYLHFLRFDAQKPTRTQSFAYFFMSPNVCFPLFPVIDFSTFVRTYYDREAALIYQSGIKWIARGLLHLILYRVVYLYLAGDPAELWNLGDVVQFVLATFLLYLRVSGQFHLIVGMLHLFGFRLPDTHHLYFLSSSFTDFWRRINIYWKEFMTKLVYYPSYFRLRRHGNAFGLAVATVTVFLATWLLHSYQWFWLRGGFPLEPQDGLFWGILAVLVVHGSLREMSRPRKRLVGPGPFWCASLALRTLGTFTAICLLWSLWSADSVMQWLLIWPAAANVGWADFALVLGLVAGFVAIAGHPWSVWETYDDARRPLYQRALVQSGATLVVLLALGITDIYERRAPSTAALVATLQQSTLNARDQSMQHKGYYENLDNSSRMSMQLWDVRAEKPAHWVGLSATEAHRSREGFLGGELVAGARIIFLDKELTVNSLGMRDRERTLAKPMETYRIAQLGPSHVMGSGVSDGETFAAFLEQRLNAVELEGTKGVEVLNFGVAGTSLLYQLAMLGERVLNFSPDLVVVTDSPRAKDAVIAGMLQYAQAGVTIPYPELEAVMVQSGMRSLANDGFPVPFDWLRSVARSLGLEVRMPWLEADRRARSVADQMTRLTLARIARTAREHDAVPIFLALDNVVEAPQEVPSVLKQARTAGFVVIDLLRIWEDTDMESLRIAPWDNHPNADGNRLIAERLEVELRRHVARLALPSSTRESEPHASN
jgi:hypothetical protein